MTTHWWRPFLWGITGLAIGSLGVMFTVSLFTLLTVTDDIQTTGRSSQDLLEALEDCTEPDGECYRESEARDAAQAGAFNAAVVATAYCVHHYPGATHRELTKCVEKILRGKVRKR